jgi:hypothetical protein
MASLATLSATGPGLAQAPTLAQRVRRSLVPDDEAVRVGKACRLAGVQMLRRLLRVGTTQRTAMLVPAADGFRAVIDPQLWEQAQRNTVARRRLRFVLAHELGHTYFYEPGAPPRRTRPADRREEGFCNRFATSLLVPPEVAATIDVDLAGLNALARDYDVSVHVAARAVAEAQPGLSVLMLRHAPHPHRGGEEAMRTTWGASRRFIAHGESFKSSLADLRPGESGVSSEVLCLSGRRRPVDIQAWRFQTSMLAIVRERRGDGPGSPCVSGAAGQLTLFTS